MAGITADQLKVAQGWMEFGQKLGWALTTCDGSVSARFLITADAHPGSSPIKVTAAMRRDIERTWREQDKPALKEVG